MWCDVMSESIMIIPASPMFHVSDRTFTMVSFIETQLARSLDGVLSFFEQESFAFSRMITSSFLCGPPRMTGAELGSRGGKSSSEWKGLKSNPNMPTSSKVLIWCVMMMKWCHTMSYDVIWCLAQGAWTNLLRAKYRQFCHLCLGPAVDQWAGSHSSDHKRCYATEARMQCV